ncbi:protein HIRA/HIR1 [Nematocida minor]|uniref:protein HIRA/HIR1 n=1 Tax=Nematocida minor TaxID=1912983 RepID=UPI002220E267|nr:protein HIRA/HIR1 [Nematocida minor]KAI5189428.1 protein HIRA/HIR1 [Nematocida minor]
MKVVLTNIAHMLNKKQSTIFSTDTFPCDVSYVVTGGQDGSVKIWKITDKESKEEGSFTKHTGAVLCTRFSPAGDLLATASDDGNVIVWGVTKTQGTIQLHTKKRLSDHRSDVSSIAWSSRYLATGGYDGSVIIYDRPSFSIVTRLEKHEKGCKGIAFSPGAGYISTYGDEGELFLYDKNLKKLSSTKKPFKGVQMESFFGRMSWSPDGKYIACGLAFLEKQDAVALLSANLARSYTLIGHTAPVETVAFNPFLWEKDGSTSYILATGSQDRSVAIWSSGSSKPLILLKEVSCQPIMDLQWSSNGKVLFGCAYDGSVFYMEFEDGEFGVPHTPVIEESRALPYSREFIMAHAEIEKMPSPEGEEEKESEKWADKKEEIENITEDTNKPEEKKKKIIPRFIKPLEEPDSAGVVRGPRVVLMTGQVPLQESIEPDRCIAQLETVAGTATVFTVEIKGNRSMFVVKKNGKEWFTAAGHSIKVVAADACILAVVSTQKAKSGSTIDTLWVYNMDKGVLVLPAMPFSCVVSVDVRNEKILVVLQGSFKVLDLLNSTTVEDRIASQSDVVNVLLDPKYFLIILYEDGSTQFYNPQMKVWFMLEMDAPSAYSDAHCGGEEKDCTFEFLENRCTVGMLYGDWALVADSIEKIIASAARGESCAPGLFNRMDAIIEEVLNRKNSQVKAEFISTLLVQCAETEEFQQYAYEKTREIKEKLAQ